MNIKKSFLEAVAKNNEEGVKSSLKQFADNRVDINDSNLNIIALKYAIFNKNASVVKLLLEHGADIKKNLDESPLLCFAAEIGNVEIVDLLLKHKRKSIKAADLLHMNIVCESNKFGTTPLHIASAKGHVEMVKFLLNNLPKYATCNPGETDNTTPLHYAAGAKKSWSSFGICSNVELNTSDFEGITSSNINGRKEIVELLLDHKANSNAKGPENKTALHYCASCPNSIDIAKLLISRGIDINAKTTDVIKKYSAMHLAAEAGNNELIELLLNSGADIEINAGDKGATPLICAISAGHLDTIKLLLNHGANIEAKSFSGSTPLMNHAHHEEMASFLLAHGANINAKDDCGQTALHRVAECYNKKTLDWLMKHGSDINSKDQDNFTPLDCAVRYGDVEVVQWLFDHGASINTEVKNKRWSSIYCAAVKNKTEIFKVLLEHGALISLDDPSRNVKSTSHPLEDIDEFFVKETTKLNSLSHYATDDYVKYIKSHKYLKNFWENCKKQIEGMKKKYFTHTNVSYYNVLMTSRTDKLATLVGNKNIAKVLDSESLKKKFPIYAESLEKRIKAGVMRKDLLERVKHFFHIITNDEGEKLPCLPWSCVHEIFSYLTSGGDLKKLIVALKLSTDFDGYQSDYSYCSSSFESSVETSESSSDELPDISLTSDRDSSGSDYECGYGCGCGCRY